MRRMMAIFAHPDDEGAIAGTLAYYARQGVEVTLVCATRGEVGSISDPGLATPETLGQVRQMELEAACKVLGIQHLEILDYRDSGMDGTPENDDSRALINASADETIAQFAGLIVHYAPDVVITFESFGWYGHPDHQAVSRWATEAFVRGANQNGIQGQRLFHAVIPFSKFGAVIQAAVEAGYIDGDGFNMDLPEEQLLKTEAAVTHVLNVEEFFEIKQDAMRAHRTQFSEEHMFRKIPRELMIQSSGEEHFIQVYPIPDEVLAQNRLHDLFADG